MMDDANREATVRRISEEQSRQENAFETARKMLSRNMSVDLISEPTGLSEDEIRSLWQRPVSGQLLP